MSNNLYADLNENQTSVQRLDAFKKADADVFAILQIRAKTSETKLFMPYKYVVKYHGEPNPDDYDVIYVNEITFDKPIKELLERMFAKFNIDRPEDFTGHSMSVSDVVLLKRDGNIEAYYTDSSGFQHLPNFVL